MIVIEVEGANPNMELARVWLLINQEGGYVSYHLSEAEAEAAITASSRHGMTVKEAMFPVPFMSKQNRELVRSRGVS